MDFLFYRRLRIIFEHFILQLSTTNEILIYAHTIVRLIICELLLFGTFIRSSVVKFIRLLKSNGWKMAFCSLPQIAIVDIQSIFITQYYKSFALASKFALWYWMQELQ